MLSRASVADSRAARDASEMTYASEIGLALSSDHCGSKRREPWRSDRVFRERECGATLRQQPEAVSVSVVQLSRGAGRCAESLRASTRPHSASNSVGAAGGYAPVSGRGLQVGGLQELRSIYAAQLATGGDEELRGVARGRNSSAVDCISMRWIAINCSFGTLLAHLAPHMGQGWTAIAGQISMRSPHIHCGGHFAPHIPCAELHI